MSLLSFPSTINHRNKTISNSLPFTSQTSHNFHRFSVHNTSLYTSSICVDTLSSPFSCQPVIKTSSSSSHRGLSLVSFDAKSDSGATDHEDHQALDTVLKLYSAIKSQNIRELSDIIGEECRCVCNFISFFQPFQGKKQVIDFFSYLIRSLGNNIEMEKEPCAIGEGFQFLHLPNLPGQGGDKERGDVHGTTPSYGAFQTQNNELRHDGSGQAELLYNDKGSETKGFIIQIIVPSILLGCTSVIFKAWIVLSHKGMSPSWLPLSCTISPKWRVKIQDSEGHY
ncbi:hypothetical protein Pint_09523 [Pistacia integerrima]|uniref:Uncharacterized protein n=1 Tax=Pistacia integerrima TaxID=434235 RepID=A0ACC0XK58_9ROSI|nr:hypothetical protein Pint_09523 [Pistacia integerrima]